MGAPGPVAAPPSRFIAQLTACPHGQHLLPDYAHAAQKSRTTTLARSPSEARCRRREGKGSRICPPVTTAMSRWLTYPAEPPTRRLVPPVRARRLHWLTRHDVPQLPQIVTAARSAAASLPRPPLFSVRV
ncbi:uncharacterized protein CC84DRAFT_1176966 [Paraphaeosphaeria sporulosa]|uniref:Uncharacterized protein n=1 Tax=Paraphaeosphaeria sporulosa TaxID=1460663 RepID=A0A177CAV6_9PLEO|nr:uncharacterized protein CC84DRAFT_1176966 [Paraphaeosphaeria sporulosa]OAG04803.1 hypothetical protein CC84DRAFT_1176966 [Paraphaeosphaeria sporulosa]